MYLVYGVVLLINLLFLMFNRRSKFIQIATIIFIIILMAGNTENGDYWAYENVYNGVYDPHFEDEYGINFIFSIGNMLKLPYQGILFFIFIACLLLNLSVAKKVEANVHLICVLYLVFGFIADTVVLRNYIALSFLTNALFYLTKKQRIKSFLLMILSLLFHKTMVFYFPLLFLDVEKIYIRRWIKWGTIGVIVLCTCVFIAGGRFESLGMLLSDILYEGNDNIYLDSRTRYGFIPYFMVQITSLIVVQLAKRKLSDNRQKCTEYEFKSALINMCYLVNMYVILSFPLIMISVAMHRLFRNVMFFTVIVLGTVLNSFSKNKISVKYANYLFIVLIYAVVWRVLYFFDIPNDFKWIMENNIFLE